MEQWTLEHGTVGTLEHLNMEHLNIGTLKHGTSNSVEHDGTLEHVWSSGLGHAAMGVYYYLLNNLLLITPVTV